MSEKNGLATSYAEQLLKSCGENTIASKRKNAPLKIFLGQFRDAMVMILLAATAVSAFLGEVYDALAIAVIVLLNAILGFIQEYKTEKTLAALKDMTAPTAKAYRDGGLAVIPAAKLVPGDIIELEAGDRVPADAVILECSSCYADESILTGESVPVSKNQGSPDDTDNSVGRSCFLYSGTVVTKGNALAKVTATGFSAQVGRISGMLSDIDEGETPLQKRLGELGKTVAIICIIVCIAVAGAGILRGEPPFDMLMTGISVAIAAIPEGLPATVTIALALAVRRMLSRKALVHRLHSVETLGCTSVICTDKTGTVTENKMTAVRAFCGGRGYDISGRGYSLNGTFSESGKSVDTAEDKLLTALLSCSVLCSNAKITELEKSHSGKNVGIQGDPTEAALLVMAAKAGITSEKICSACRRISEIPFDSETRRMSVICNVGGAKKAFSKGAVDVILPCCTEIMTKDGIKPLTSSLRRKILSENEKMADEALRVLAFCEKIGDASDLENGMVFLGLVGMTDPPRPEAIEAVKLCKKAKIRTVMITGDHKNTAAAVAKKAGIFQDGDFVLTGKELARLSDDELDSRLNRISVYARATPEDKLRIVRAFKRRGEIVTMTGDGVNDAPAVKEASVGISMGITGTDVAKEAADVVLLDDNFATLVKAVEQGRGVYTNIRKFVRYLLSCNIGEVLTMLLGIAAGLPTVLLPTQLLLVNLATDGLPAVALGVEPVDPECMNRPPRKADESFFSGGLLKKIIFRGVLIGLCTLGCFIFTLHMSGSTESARTAALFTLVMTQLAHVFECKSESRNIFTVPYFNNPKLILAALSSLIIIFAAIYLPFMQAVFSTVALSYEQLGIAFGFAMAAPLLQCVIRK